MLYTFEMVDGHNMVAEEIKTVDYLVGLPIMGYFLISLAFFYQQKNFHCAGAPWRWVVTRIIDFLD